MTQLINYLGRAVPGRSYDEVELARLQQVYERACEALAVPVGDARRENVATLLFNLEGTTSTTSELVSRVVSAFRQRA